jgi:hypothetical protein
MTYSTLVAICALQDGLLGLLACVVAELLCCHAATLLCWLEDYGTAWKI